MDLRYFDFLMKKKFELAKREYLTEEEKLERLHQLKLEIIARNPTGLMVPWPVSTEEHGPI